MPARRDQPVDVTLPPSGVFVLESHHAAGFRMAEQRHDFLELFYVLDGAGTFHVAGREYPCRGGDVVVVPAGQSHSIEDSPDRPTSVYAVCAAPRAWAAEPGLVEHLPAGPLALGPGTAARLRADLRRMLFEQTHDRPGSRALVAGLTLELLALLARAGRSRPGKGESRRAVERYVADLPHHFFETTDLDRAAADHGMSRRRFTDLFRQVTGTTRADYLTGLRVDHACRLLCDPRRGVAAVAFECGFDDLSSFYRAFKRRTGMPPAAWRKAGQE